MTNKKRLGITVPIGLYEILKTEIAYTGQTFNSLILQILWEWAKENGLDSKQEPDRR